MASRRLTKALREVFVRAVMDDVPSPDEDLCTKELEDILMKYTPQCVKDTLKISHGWLDLRSHHVTADSNVVGFKEYDRNSFYLRYYWDSWHSSDLPEEAQLYIEKLKGILTDRIVFRQKLEGVVAACTTVKALTEALPELKKYAPDDTPEVKKGLPAVANLMADAVMRGWPGGKIVGGKVVPA